MKFRNTLTIATIATIGSLSIYSPSYAATPTRLVQLSPIQRIAIAAEPQSAEDYVERGKAKLEAKDYEGAMVEYTRAIELNPESYEAFEGRAYVNSVILKALAEKKKSSGDSPLTSHIEVMKDITEGMRLVRDSELSFNNGKKKLKDKDYSGAISDFDRVIKIGVPKHSARTYVLRGGVKYGLGRKQDAIRDIEFGAERFRKLGDIKSYDKAMKLIERITKSN